MLKNTLYAQLGLILLACNLLCCNPACRHTGKITALPCRETRFTNDKNYDIRGQLVLTTNNKLITCIRENEKSFYVEWDGQGLETGRKYFDFIDNGELFALDSNGSFYILSWLQQADAEKAHLQNTACNVFIVNAGGEITDKFTIDKLIPGSADDVISRILAGPGKNLVFLTKNKKITVRSLITGETRTFGNSVTDMALDTDGNLLFVNTINRELYYMEKVNIQSGETVWKRKAELTTAPVFIAINPGNNYLYLLLDDKVQVYDEKGVPKNYCSLSGSGMKGFDIYPAAMAVNAAGEIYILGKYALNNLQKRLTEIYKYSPAAKANEDATAKTITFSTVEGNQFLYASIRKYQELYPGIKIVLDEYNGAAGSTADFDAYVKKISTEMLSGKGADLINITGLPYTKYIEKGALENLRTFIGQDNTFREEDYFMNLINAFEYKGNLFTIPAGCAFVLMAANNKILEKEAIRVNDLDWTWQDFLRLAVKVSKAAGSGRDPGQSALPGIKAAELFNVIFISHFGKFIDLEKKTAYFDSGAFIDFLDSTGKYINNDITNQSIDINQAVICMEDMSTIAFMPFYVYNFQGYLTLDAMFDFDSRAFFLPVAVKDEHYFGAGILPAINSNSRYKQEAWEFIKFLLSEEIQIYSEQNLNGFPVNRKAFWRITEEALKPGESIHQVGKKILKHLDTEDADRILKFLEQHNRYMNFDPQIYGIAMQEIGLFLEGVKSPQETARIIQGKIDIYLNE